MKLKNLWKHFWTVTRHRYLVMEGCFCVGLYRQGLTHDLSKFSPQEFWNGVRYYQGSRSPNTAERKEKGYSEAWMHHKGRNRHHYEYWTDLDVQTRRYVPVEMPRKYVVEMVMDRRAACMTYEGEDYTAASPLNYFIRSSEKDLMHPNTSRLLELLLTMLQNRGERFTFRFIREQILSGKPLPWEHTAASEASTPAEVPEAPAVPADPAPAEAEAPAEAAEVST